MDHSLEGLGRDHWASPRHRYSFPTHGRATCVSRVVEHAARPGTYLESARPEDALEGAASGTDNPAVAGVFSSVAGADGQVAAVF